tara:strand:- start:1535 stop:3169 length:1635 start_codon:yes stop_codon:yes gene_type:complete
MVEKLKDLIEGDVETSKEVLDEYSRDTSLFKVMPEIVVFPKHAEDVCRIVKFVNEHRKQDPHLSITGRSAGSDMSGGPLNESIILSFTRYMNDADVHVDEQWAKVSPGIYYRDFEKMTLPKHVYIPTFPASKSICALGGMVMNNSGGEQTLRYGQTRDFVDEITMVLSDGNEYTFRNLHRNELEEQMQQDNFWGKIHRKVFNLLEKNYDIIKAAKPKTSKNSAGYALWDIWDKEWFRLPQLFVGSQGTLGLMTNARIRLVRDKPHKRLVALFLKDWEHLPNIVNRLLPIGPESLEAFDDETLKLGLRFMPGIAKKVGTNILLFMFQFIPEAIISLRMFGLPRLIILVQIVEDTYEEVDRKVKDVQKVARGFPIWQRTMRNEKEAEKYWVMRRESFSLLRKHVSNKKTAPFIDDFCVDPKHIPEFLPKMLAILKKNGIRANIAGHAGSGNFHVIPLMDLSQFSERAKIPVVANEVYDLIISYGGTITAEHNDGIIRTPYLEKMYGEEVYDLFKQIKEIFDPQNIFNPGKKVGGTLSYMKEHIAKG